MHNEGVPSQSLSARTKLIDIAAISLLLGSLLWLVPIGYHASDDGQYLVAATALLSDSGSSVEHEATARRVSHQNLRLSLVLPMAASIGLLGESELSVVFPTTAYFFVLMVFTYLAMAEAFDRRTALTVSALLVTLPILATHATIANVDIPLMFFVLLSLGLYYRATSARSPSRLLFGAGVAAGFAWLAHETVAVLLVLYGLLFLRGLYLPRRAYVFIALGFGAFLAAETAWYLTTTGDPLYRLTAMVQPIRKGPPVIAPIHGYPCEFTSNRTACSTLNLFIRMDFGLLFYLAIPAGWAACRSDSLSSDHKRLLKLLAALAILWFVFVVHIVQLKPRPRFFMVPAFSSVVLLGCWIEAQRQTARRQLARSAFVTLITTNAACLYLMDRDQMFGERALADFVAGVDEPVYTDPRLADRATKFLHWQGEGVADRVLAERPPPGSLFFFYETTASSGVVAGGALRHVAFSEARRLPSGVA